MVDHIVSDESGVHEEMLTIREDYVQQFKEHLEISIGDGINVKGLILPGDDAAVDYRGRVGPGIKISLGPLDQLNISMVMCALYKLSNGNIIAGNISYNVGKSAQMMIRAQNEQADIVRRSLRISNFAIQNKRQLQIDHAQSLMFRFPREYSTGVLCGIRFIDYQQLSDPQMDFDEMQNINFSTIRMFIGSN
jgi:hypothetical protein